MCIVALIPGLAHFRSQPSSARTHHACRQQERQSHRERGIDTRGPRPSPRAGLRIRRGVGQELHKRREGLLRRCENTAEAATGSFPASTRRTQQHPTDQRRCRCQIRRQGGWRPLSPQRGEKGRQEQMRRLVMSATTPIPTFVPLSTDLLGSAAPAPIHSIRKSDGSHCREAQAFSTSRLDDCQH